MIEGGCGQGRLRICIKEEMRQVSPHVLRRVIVPPKRFTDNVKGFRFRECHPVLKRRAVTIISGVFLVEDRNET